MILPSVKVRFSQCLPGGIVEQQEPGLVQSLQACAHVAAQRAPTEHVGIPPLNIRPFFPLR